MDRYPLEGEREDVDRKLEQKRCWEYFWPQFWMKTKQLAAWEVPQTRRVCRTRVSPGTGSSPKPRTVVLGSQRPAARPRNAALLTAPAPEPLVWEERGKKGRGSFSRTEAQLEGRKKITYFFSAQVSIRSVCICMGRGKTTRGTRDLCTSGIEPWVFVRDTKPDPRRASQRHPLGNPPMAGPS